MKLTDYHGAVGGHNIGRFHFKLNEIDIEEYYKIEKITNKYLQPRLFIKKSKEYSFEIGCADVYEKSTITYTQRFFDKQFLGILLWNEKKHEVEFHGIISHNKGFDMLEKIVNKLVPELELKKI